MSDPPPPDAGQSSDRFVSPDPVEPTQLSPPPRRAVARAYAVHVFTASGVAFAFLAVAELCKPAPDPRLVFAWLAIQVLIDAFDGPLARAWEVKRFAPRISGRTIDDLVDFLTYTFVPLVMIWRLGWVPEPGALFVIPAMVASLFGFSNSGAKDEAGGFFLGFPSYWNIVAFYLGISHAAGGSGVDGGGGASVGVWFNGVTVLGLTLLTVLPVRFIYPNLAPRPWRVPMLVGGGLWLVLLIVMTPPYPRPAGWLVWVSLIYPACYVALSLRLSTVRRR